MHIYWSQIENGEKFLVIKPGNFDLGENSIGYVLRGENTRKGVWTFEWQKTNNRLKMSDLFKDL